MGSLELLLYFWSLNTIPVFKIWNLTFVIYHTIISEPKFLMMLCRHSLTNQGRGRRPSWWGLSMKTGWRWTWGSTKFQHWLSFEEPCLDDNQSKENYWKKYDCHSVSLWILMVGWINCRRLDFAIMNFDSEMLFASMIRRWKWSTEGVGWSLWLCLVNWENGEIIEVNVCNLGKITWETTFGHSKVFFLAIFSKPSQCPILTFGGVNSLPFISKFAFNQHFFLL